MFQFFLSFIGKEPLQICALETFQQSYHDACARYSADWDVRPSVAYLYRFILDSIKLCADDDALNDLSAEVVDAANRDHGWFSGRFFDREPGAVDPNTAAFLRSISHSIPLTEYSSVNWHDDDSRVYVWQPSGRKYRQHARAVGIYLHHPSDARVLLHVWIGANHDIESCLAEFERADFNWGNLSPWYGRWLAQPIM